MATAETRYAATVTAVGEQVPEFIGQGLLIWFAEGAPEELHFFTVLHRPTVTTGGVRPGDLVRIDDKAFRVTAVGEVANDNMVNLGHIDMKANGASEAPLPGDLCLEELPLPEPRPGTMLVIEREAAEA
ncbi:MAG TPA: PTS glucitol/sorbitol transporter subunit IIA [Actinomycetes bacterium]|jgi:PTS system glucitol/sorbitol-specific IIA component|nr:PTS glucitol/sorbitol transporter subunit IIA [Actinomycetes bacterium]